LSKVVLDSWSFKGPQSGCRVQFKLVSPPVYRVADAQSVHTVYTGDHLSVPAMAYFAAGLLTALCTRFHANWARNVATP